MLWHYRTMLFEFTKDGLLGDKYVDEEEMEKTLNTFGRQGWELVNAVLLQDGVLVFLKRPSEPAPVHGEEERPRHNPEPDAPKPPVLSPPFSMEKRPIQGEAPESGHNRAGRRRMQEDAGDDEDTFGGIRIA